MASHKSRIHRVVTELVFDKPCTPSHAVAQAKNCIATGSSLYPTALREGDPGEMKVRRITRLPPRGA